MAFKTILLLLGFMFFSVGALFIPLVGVIGYVVHYHFWPENHWWGQALSSWNLRYAFTIGLCLLVGTLLNKHKLKLNGVAMKGHEWLLLLFWATAVASIWTGIDVSDYSTQGAHQNYLIDKLSKVILFCLLMSHVVTTPKRVNLLFWTLIIGTLYVGHQAWCAPVWKFTRARLEGIGGPDFRESSYLGAHFALILPIIGIQFLRGGWKAKAICLAAGGFAMNGLILTRTRAAFLGVCVGVIAAFLFALKGRRRRIFLYLLPGILVGGYLTDAGFRHRMQTIRTDPAPTETPEDASAYNRLIIWQAAGRMFMDHPMGVGAGNFRALLSSYVSGVARRDAHNTVIRCAVELGVPGITVLCLVVASAVLCLVRARWYACQCPDAWQLRYFCYGTGVSLAVLLTTSFFMTQLYIEEFWWMLTLPVCVLRAAEHEYAWSRETEWNDEAEGAPVLTDVDLCPSGLGWG